MDGQLPHCLGPTTLVPTWRWGIWSGLNRVRRWPTDSGAESPDAHERRQRAYVQKKKNDENQAGKPNAAERRKSSRSGSRLDEIGQARRRLYWRALRCSKQLKRPPQTARRPAEEQAERGAARTPALFSSANARTTARLLRGSSFLPSFLCFVFTYFPLYAASRVGKGSSFLLLPSLLPLFAALAFIRTLRLSTQFI